MNIAIPFDGEVDVDVVCNICGKSVEATHYKDELIIDPCETCLGKAKEEGIEEGGETSGP